MIVGRREFIIGAAGILLSSSAFPVLQKEASPMYGLIAKIVAGSGQRDALIGILLSAVKDLPGCLQYVIAKDSADENAIWITEVWDSKASHDASLSLPQVKQAMTAGRPMIASFGQSVATTPVGGFGLTVRDAR